MRKLITLWGGLLLLGCTPAGPPAATAAPPDRPPVALQAGPIESVYAVAFSPDGRLLASGGFDGIRIYDGRTGALLRAVVTEPCRGVRGLAFSPDGKGLASVGLEMDGAVKLWDPRTGALVRALAGHAATAPGNLYADLYAVAFSPDGKLLATAGMDKAVIVWDLETGKPRHRLAGHEAEVGALAFSPDGKALAGGGADKAVRLWDPATGRLLATFRGHADRVNAVAFSPDGKALASGASEYSRFHYRDLGAVPPGEGEVRLWDPATGKAVWRLAARGRVSSLAFSPDGDKLACGAGQAVRVYDAATGRAEGSPITHDREVTSVAFAPDGRALVSGSHDRSVRRVAFPAGTPEWRLPGCWEQVNAVALSPDGSLLATGSSDLRFAERELKAGARELDPGQVRLWDMRTGGLLRRLGDPAEQVMAVAVSPDGLRVAGGGGKADGSGVVRVWTTRAGEPAWSKGDHSAEVLALAFAPDGSLLASAGADGLVQLRDPATGAVRRALRGHEGGATSVAFSADGAALVCGAADGTAHLWDVRTGRQLQTFRPAGSKAKTVTRDRLITSVALTPDRGTLAACTASVGPTFGEPVRLWDTRTGEPKRTLPDQWVGGRLIALSPDGSTLATGGKTIKLWDVRTGRRLRELHGPFKKTQSITFSADGRLLVSGATYRATNVWEVATGRLLATLVTFPEGRPGAGTDHWLAYTPEGDYDGSPGAGRHLAWRTGRGLETADRLDRHRPGLVSKSLRGR